MSIIIKLQEKNNKLLFSATPIALLCGNSNYQLNIDFDEDWSRFSTKTAVFSINCKNHLVEFSGNTVDVPCLPNCHNMNFYVMCSDENLGQRTTNTLSFDLIPTKKKKKRRRRRGGKEEWTKKRRSCMGRFRDEREHDGGH